MPQPVNITFAYYIKFDTYVDWIKQISGNIVSNHTLYVDLEIRFNSLSLFLSLSLFVVLNPKLTLRNQLQETT